jgi:hypothetical protein
MFNKIIYIKIISIFIQLKSTVYSDFTSDGKYI